MAIVTKQELLDALRKVSLGLGAKENGTQTTGIMFRNGKIFTYNDEVSLQTALPEPLVGLRGVVYGKPLVLLLSSLPDINIDVAIVDNALQIKGHKSRTKLVLDTDIRMPTLDYSDNWKDLPKDFSIGMRGVLPIAGKNMSKPLSTCIRFEGNRIEASDVDRGARYVFYEKEDDVVTQTADFPLTYVPKTSMATIIKLEPVQYQIIEGWMVFKTIDNTVGACRTYYNGQEGADIEPLLQQSGTVLELPETLQQALNRNSIFSKAEAAEYSAESNFARLTFKENKCYVSGKGSAGEYKEVIETKYEGKVISFLIKEESLTEALNRGQKCELCTHFIKLYDDKLSYLVALKMIDSEGE